MKIVKISSKNQVTIPSELLLSLGLQPTRKLILQVENNSLTMKPLKTSVVEQVADSLTKYISPSKLGVPFSKILKETKKKTAVKLAKTL
ncbi:AbrB/MazE/SpoVT family DNA-binding domain-containing protein [Candidatus Microgenomates bacterium]|nr:AbrB/MazE/SpoVT family DNA-binding domain-containing protein [Candidatus Microgenomates bacterium]